MHKVGVWSGSFLIAPKFRLAPTFGGSLAFFGPWNAQRAMLTSQVDMTCQCLSGSFIKQLKLVWLFHALSLGEHCGMWINALQNPWLFSPNVTNTYFKNLASVCSCALLHPWKISPNIIQYHNSWSLGSSVDLLSISINSEASRTGPGSPRCPGLLVLHVFTTVGCHMLPSGGMTPSGLINMDEGCRSPRNIHKWHVVCI